MAKSGGFSSFDYTYGVGLEFKASSAKQIKNELKVNLDSLSKMIKSYEKVLKIDPNADLSKLFAEMQKIKGIVDGINNSDNSFATFVDKGLLSRIASLEKGLLSISSVSKEVEANLASLKGDIELITSSLKAAGEIKFPATFDNLFGDIKNQKNEIKQVFDQIKLIERALDDLRGSSAKYTESLNSTFDGLFDLDQFSKWLEDFITLQTKIKNNKGMPLDKLYKDILQLSQLGQKINHAYTVMPEDVYDKLETTKTGTNLNNFTKDLQFITKQIDAVIKQIDVEKTKLESKLNDLQSVQSQYQAKQGLQKSSGKSLGIQSDYNAQVKVTPKTNESEWATKINDTIKNITPNLDPVQLKPTFSKSKNINKELEGNLAQINHAVNVDLQVTDNIEKFNEKIQNIDRSIKNAKSQLEQNGNFKLRFEYEEGGNFKDVAYKIINQLKHVDVSVDAKTTKAFLKQIAQLVTDSNKKLKNISATVALGNEKEFLGKVDNLHTQITQKIGNIGVNLTLANIEQFIGEAALMRDSVESYYNKNPIGAVLQSDGTQTASQGIVELSDKAKKAQESIAKIEAAIKSLNSQKFSSPAFLELGMLNKELNPIANSKERLERFLKQYNDLVKKLNANQYAHTEEGYAEYLADDEQYRQAQNILDELLSRQLAYSQKKLEIAKQILAEETKIATEKQKQVNSEDKGVSNAQKEVKLSMSKKDAVAKKKELKATIKEQQQVLDDLSKNSFNSSYFTKLGEWDKKSNSFKKNSQEVQKLLNKYNALKKARMDAGGKKAIGEEASLRSKLGAILSNQKKHAAEIIGQNKKELESVEQITKAYEEKDGGKKKSTNKQFNADIAASTKKIEELTEKLNKAKTAVDSLTKGKKNKISAARYTGLGDINNRLNSPDKKQDYFEVLKLYDKLEQAQNKLRKSGQTQSDEYKQNQSILNSLKKQLRSVYDDQLKYSKTRVVQLEEEIAKEKEKQQILIQQQKEAKKQNKQAEAPKEKSKGLQDTKPKSSIPDQPSNTFKPDASVVKLDASTLGSLAKDTTLQSIDSKISSILTQFVQGVKITGANVSIESNGVTISDNASGDSVVLNNPNVNISEMSGRIANITDTGNIALLLEQLNEFVATNSTLDSNYRRMNTAVTTNSAGSITGAQITYASKDGLNAITEYYKLVTTDAKTKTKEFQHISTVVTENIKAYETNIVNATKKQNNLFTSANKSILSLEGSLDPNAKKSLASSEYEEQVKTKIQAIRQEVEKLDSYTDGKRVLFSDEGLSNQKKLIESMVADVQVFITQSKNALYPDITSQNKEVSINTISSYSRQLVTFEEQAKRSGVYTDELRAKIAELNTQLNEISVQGDLDTYKFDFDRFKEDFEKLKTYDKLYKDFIKSQAKQIKLNDKIATSSGSTEKLKQQLAIEEENSRNLELQLQRHSELYTARSRQLAIDEAIKQANKEIVKSLSDQADKASNKQAKDLQSIVNKAQNKYDKMLYSSNNSKAPLAGKAIENLREYESLLNNLKTMASTPGILDSENGQKSLDNLLLKMNSVQKNFNSLTQSADSFFKKIKSSSDMKIMDEGFDANNLTQMHNAMRDFANQLGPCEDKLTKFNDAERTATFAIKNEKGEMQQITVAYNEATNALGRYVSATVPAISQSQKFLNSLKHSFGNVVRYIASFGSIYRLFAVIKQGVQYVKDIDSALTELKKVTSETDATYDRFLQSMSKTAGVVGSTVSELTTMASEWARLGYSIQEAGNLAESTAILLNVSEFTDATEASQALISTMQAFGYAADESRHVVDILNEVGKFIARR